MNHDFFQITRLVGGMRDFVRDGKYHVRLQIKSSLYKKTWSFKEDENCPVHILKDKGTIRYVATYRDDSVTFYTLIDGELHYFKTHPIDIIAYVD